MSNSSVTLKERAYEIIRERIISGELKPGDVLTERTLVEMLGMSRTPIRAALERLDANGLAKYTPNKGLIVNEMSLQKVIDLYDFRIAMESFVVRKLSAQHWNEEDVTWFEENLRQQERSMREQDYEAFTQADWQFHRNLAAVLGNAEILQAMDQLQDKLYLTALKVLRKDRSRIQVSYEDHVRLFQEIRSGNAQLAVSGIERHLEYGKQILVL
ncbi:GntR family transcriptional regulator [Cohnella sp. CIP 111063]|uniref:GntR family transcriptional regulator n=1 Tax=unclassified Cohnella TaxID=2636738 RepID=UPI000B8BD6BF|nr:MULTISPECIES: GntR family transcriptional regulator [unclassified Cohnella]OXS52914.1 GntR family transcriptional regulator [Cohnella sp. CIP 111063]PRX60166.1 DNA-binding GntR family transcriptional regulator [Cohnella sp. SGD-V74]